MLRSGTETGLFVNVMEGLGKFPMHRTFELSSTEAEAIYQASGAMLLHYSQNSLNWNRPGIDGIFVEGSLLSDHFALGTFKFRSPQKNDYPHQLIDTLFSPLKSNIPDDLFRDYYAGLWGYFHH